MVYMVTYDLNKTGQDYENVINAIKAASNGVYIRCCMSSWLIKSNLTTASAVMSVINPSIDQNDDVIVIEVKDNYNGFLSNEKWDYIRQEIFS